MCYYQFNTIIIIIIIIYIFFTRIKITEATEVNNGIGVSQSGV